MDRRLPGWRRLRVSSGGVLLGLMLVPFLLASTDASVVSPLLLVNGTVVTMDGAHRILRSGHVLVGEDGVIEAVWSGVTPAGVSTAGAHVVDAGRAGLVFPGLLDIHDHPTFAMLPTWPAPSSHAQPNVGRPKGSEPYDFRYEWGGGTGGPSCWPSPPWSAPPEEVRLVTNASAALTDGNKLGLMSQALVYAEARAALGGETAIEGEAGDPANGLIVRDADQTNFGVVIHSRVPSIDHCFDPAPVKIELNQGQPWLVHLAEGVRDSDAAKGDDFSSRQEFRTLRKLGLLTSATVIVHGTALERSDFAAMHRAGAKLVWSPLSNLLLYGHTTNVYDALAQKVPVSLGTDWSPTGSPTLLDELKIADITLRDRRLLARYRPEVPALSSDAALDRTLVDMVTRNPAQALRWPVGSIEPGKHADLLIINRPADSPTGGMPNTVYRNLIDATERDVRLVLVDGKPVAGDPSALAAAGATDIALVASATGNYRKAIAFRNGNPPPKLRLPVVERTLTTALHALGGDNALPASGQPPPSATFTYLHTHWNNGADKNIRNDDFRLILTNFAGLNDGRINLERIDLAPLLTDDNHWYFTIVQGKRTPTGIPDDPAPPFRPYATNVNQATSRGNPFANLHNRWYK